MSTRFSIQRGVVGGLIRGIHISYIFTFTYHHILANDIKIWVLSLEIRPLTGLYPPTTQKMCFTGPLSVIVGGGMLMPTAFAPLYIVSVKNNYMEGGGSTLLGV